MSWVNRVYNWVTDRNNGVPITASRMDAEFNNVITALNECINTQNLNAPTTDISWGSNKITSLADPTAAQDAATKNYVDTLVTGNTHIIAHDATQRTFTAVAGIAQFPISIEDLDTLGEFVAGNTPSFTATNTGLYLMSGWLAVTPSADCDVDLYLYKNATVEKHFPNRGINGQATSIRYNALLNLTAADVITILLDVSSDVTIYPDLPNSEPRHVNQLSIVRIR